LEFTPVIEFDIVNTSQVNGDIRVWYRQDGSSTSFFGSPIADNQELLGSVLRISHDSDNTFSYFRDLSFTSLTSYTVKDAATDGFSMFERGGNDTVQIRAVTSIDALGTPTGFTPFFTVGSSTWGDIEQVSYTIFDSGSGNTDGPYEGLHQANGTQPISAVVVSFDSFGLSSGDTVYGYQFANTGGLDYIPSAAVVEGAVIPEPQTSLLLFVTLASALGRRRR